MLYITLRPYSISPGHCKLQKCGAVPSRACDAGLCHGCVSVRHHHWGSFQVFGGTRLRPRGRLGYRCHRCILCSVQSTCAPHWHEAKPWVLQLGSCTARQEEGHRRQEKGVERHLYLLFSQLCELPYSLWNKQQIKFCILTTMWLRCKMWLRCIAQNVPRPWCNSYAKEEKELCL